MSRARTGIYTCVWPPVGVGGVGEFPWAKLTKGISNWAVNSEWAKRGRRESAQ